MDRNKHSVREVTPGERDLVWLKEQVPDATHCEQEDFIHRVGMMLEHDYTSEYEDSTRTQCKDELLTRREF